MSGEPSRDVSALWEALKAQGAPAARRAGAGPSLSGLSGLPGITSTVRTYNKSQGPGPQPGARPSFIAQLGETARVAGAQQPAGGDCQALLASLQRDINGLSDPDRATRRRSVERLQAALLAPGVAPDALQAALAGPLLVPLVRLLADPSEACRERAASLLAAALPRLPGPGGAAPLLPVLVPALAERVGAPPVQEPSEELRLALAELVAGPLLGAAPRPLPAELLPPLCGTLCCQLADAYADIKKAACASVAALADLQAPAALPAELLAPLAGALAANLAHAHSRVRLSAVQALHALVLHGVPTAVMEEIVLPAVRPLAYDHAPAVRAALFSSAAQWAGSQLPPRGGGGADDEGRAANQARAFLPLLLPLLLVGLTDEAEATRAECYAQLDALAARLQGRRAAPGGASPVAVDPSSQRQQQQQQQQQGRQAPPGYCHPFGTGPPSPTARALVQAQLARLLQQALAELREWTAVLRLLAARLLRAALIYGEGEVLPQLPSVVHALRAAVADDDAGVAAHAVGCLHVLGVTLLARHWLPLAAELATAEQQSAAQRTAALVALSALLYGAGRSGAAADAGSVQLAADALSAPGLSHAAAAPDGGPVRQQLLAAASNLANWAGPGCKAVAPQLFQLLLRLWAVEAAAQLDAAAEKAADAGSGAGVLTAAAVLDQLAAACGAGSAAGLCERYGPGLLSHCMQSRASWTHAHPDWRSVAALLRLSSAAALAQLAPAALPALQAVAADHERDPRLRLELLQLAAALLADDAKAGAWPEPGVGRPLVAGVLLPTLVWRAGRVPAAARLAALSAIATLLDCQRLPAAQLQQLAAGADDSGGPWGDSGSAAASGPGGGLLAGVAGCLDEEYEPDNRQLACATLGLLLRAVGPALPPQRLAALRPDLLRRLDDSSNHVRVAACGALQAWLAAAQAAGEAGGSAGGGLADADAASLATTLLIHLDDSDSEVVGAVCAALEQLAAARPAAVRPLAQAAAVQPERRPLLARVVAACG